ncbi:endonuclease III domain-containing protein, partial [Streptococcus uberis]|uniref:endonuclease III domain-containing protein n=1 Tax=Streptococcus uberis TaxID=1349 RepID=UPI0037BA46C4
MKIGKVRLKKIMAIISDMFPEAKGELEWEQPYQLLIAVILSAQTTDKAVNKVTPFLWAKYPHLEDLASANLTDVELILKSIGLYKTKARNIIKPAQILVDNDNGQVPKTHKELETLPGVGRKTANVVLGEVYASPGIAVDTHVSRVAKRL